MDDSSLHSAIFYATNARRVELQPKLDALIVVQSSQGQQHEMVIYMVGNVKAFPNQVEMEMDRRQKRWIPSHK